MCYNQVGDEGMNVKIIGAGLAGVEAAWYLANHGVNVNLYEMRPIKSTGAHKTEMFAELVCSNSLRADGLLNGVGLLKAEMEMFDSIVMKSARKNAVKAGGALAVDRESFSLDITNMIKNHPLITVINEEVLTIDDTPTIICSGPLTSDNFSQAIKDFLGEEYFYFFDAAAPIVTADSINYDVAYLKSRYDKGEAAYLNCPMTREQFDKFYSALIEAECVVPHDFELKVFEGCMPVEVMAQRGRETLLFGPLKPVGLEHNGIEPYAVVQLRQDNFSASLYNIVGFQTHMKFASQAEVIRLIPGLENAKIVRYGVMHRNSFINSPLALVNTYQTKKNGNIFFAGQITGVEGYVESAASGLAASINMLKMLKGEALKPLPAETMMGAMVNYITHTSSVNFQPMNANFGLLPELGYKHKKKDRKMLYSQRALKAMEDYIKNLGD